MSSLEAPAQSQFVVRLFVTYVSVMALSTLVARGLVEVLGGPSGTTEGLVLPPAFLYSSVLLIVGSMFLHRAITQVRIERQKPFRQALVISLIAGALFVAFQTYGLWYLLKASQPARNAETGVIGFAFVFAILHAFHFTVAMMFLVFVTLKSFQDRYDHEYYFGVSVCTWFWHGLGIVWVAILMVFFFSIRHPQ
jgi:heme/copper-type cytochrome/quinol oxidase subunit 3